MVPGSPGGSGTLYLFPRLIPTNTGLSGALSRRFDTLPKKLTVRLPPPASRVSIVVTYGSAGSLSTGWLCPSPPSPSSLWTPKSKPCHLTLLPVAPTCERYTEFPRYLREWTAGITRSPNQSRRFASFVSSPVFGPVGYLAADLQSFAQPWLS